MSQECYMCGNRIKSGAKPMNKSLGVLMHKHLKLYELCLNHVNSGERFEVDSSVFFNPEYRRKWRVFHYHFTGKPVKLNCPTDN